MDNTCLLGVLDLLFRSAQIDHDSIQGGVPSSKWKAIREMYSLHDYHSNGYDPYLTDWVRLFTPIESSAWEAIRYRGLPFYPQYPIDRFFVDFADPDKKLIIDCDGKEFHNAKSDGIRDEKLISLGWTVFRVSGAECIRYIDPPESDDSSERDMRRWATETIDGLIAALAWKYYGSRSYSSLLSLLDSAIDLHQSTGVSRGKS